MIAGEAFSQSFGAAADILTHGALGLAVVVVAVILWRTHRPPRAWLAAGDAPG